MKSKWLSVLIGLAVLGPLGASAERESEEDFGGDPFGDSPGAEVNAEQALKFVGTHSPLFREALVDLRREDPEEFAETMDDISRFIEEFREVQQEDPAEAEMMLQLEVKEMESEIVAQRFHETKNPEQKAKLREQLGGMLNQLFELKQHAQEKELHYLEREMRELRERLGRRAENRQRIIERRMKDLLGDHEDDWMDW